MVEFEDEFDTFELKRVAISDFNDWYIDFYVVAMTKVNVIIETEDHDQETVSRDVWITLSCTGHIGQKLTQFKISETYRYRSGSIPKQCVTDQTKKFIKVTNGEGLPISHIANLCYLPEFENRSKGSKNFYQDTNYLSKAGTTIETIEEKYSFTSKPDLEFMDLEYQDGDFDILRLYYVDEFLANRNKIVRKKFLESLGFENAEEVVAPVQEIQSETVFNEQYYRTTKIGHLVRETFNYLSRNGYFSDVDVKNLKNKDYSLKELGVAYPVLLEMDQDPHDSRGTMRYYKDFVEINGHKYYLTSEWFEHDRKLVVPWIKKKLGQI